MQQSLLYNSIVTSCIMYCNFISFYQARNFLDPAEIFKGEAEESLEKTQVVLNVCTMWKDLFLQTRANMGQLFKDPENVKNWEFANELAFARLDKFVERVAVVEVRG